MFNKIFTPKDEVEYNQGGVAVKIVFEADDKHSIRIIALDKDQEVPTHSVEAHACVYMLEGTIEFTIENEHRSLNKDEMMIMPKTAPHSLLAKTQAKVMVVRL